VETQIPNFLNGNALAFPRSPHFLGGGGSLRIVFYDRGERFAVVAYGYIHGRLMGDLIGQRGTFGNSPHRQETDNWNSVKGD